MSNKPALYITCGFPGSGKSYFVQYQKDLACVCPDDYRFVLSGGRDFAPELEEGVWFAVKAAVRATLHGGRSVFVDATNLTIHSRKQWITIAKEFGVPLSVYFMNVPYEICLERNLKRSRVVPIEVMEQMKESFEVPTEQEGFYLFNCIPDEKFDPLTFLKKAVE